MKKIQVILSLLVIASMFMSACAEMPEPGDNKPADEPLIIWPVVCTADGSRCFQKVNLPGGYNELPGQMPRLGVDYELLEVAPMTREQTLLNISEFGIEPGEQVYILILPDDFKNFVSIPGGSKLASPIQAGLDPKTCAALCVHLIERVVGNGLTWGVVTAMVSAGADGEVVPNVVRMNKDGQMAMQFVVEGVKWLVLFGGSNSPTAIGPVVGDTLGRITGAFTSKMKPGEGKALTVANEFKELMKCVITNWPKNQEDAEKARKDHNNDKYSGRKVDKIPADFPMPFPKKIMTGEEGTVMVTIHSGDFSGAERAALNTMIALGIIIVVMDAVPFDDPIAVGLTLHWAGSAAMP